MPDVDKIVQLSEFYGVTTDYLLKGEGAPLEENQTPESDGPDFAPYTPPASVGSAAARGVSAVDAFVRVWPVLGLVGSAAAALLFCGLWFMGGFWFASTFAHMGVVAVVGTLASAFGTVLFELGALAVPGLKRRRVFFYSYAVWALALLPCCAISGFIDFVFSNWLWWRLESALGSVAATVFRIGMVCLLPLIVYGGACTSVRDALRERENARSDTFVPETD